MLITELCIENFRSIEKLRINPSPFSIVVGRNNHGKTNFFEALRWFFNGFDRSETEEEIRFRHANKSGSVSVTLTFRGLQEALETVQNQSKKTALGKIFKEEDLITIRRSTEVDSGKKRQLLNPSSGNWENTMGADGAWNDLLPRLEYVNTKLRLTDVNGYKKSSPISEMLSGVLSTIIESDLRYKKFRTKFEELFSDDESSVRQKLNEVGDKVEVYLTKQFPEGAKVRFHVENPAFDDLLKNFTTEIDDGVVTNAEEKGDGMQRAVMLSIIQAYVDFRRANANLKRFLFLIDEAELHLHPSAQRALKGALLSIAERGEQVFINTHSSVFVTDSQEDNIVFKAEKINKKTSINKVESPDLRDVIYELLGGSPADLLMPLNFLIVEGKSEYEFLKIVMKRFYGLESKGVQIIFSGGDITEQEGSLHGVHKVYNPIATSETPLYKNRAVILCDKPNGPKQERKMDQFKTGYPYLKEGKQIHVLPECSIEEYYPGEWKKSVEETKQLDKDQGKVHFAKEVATAISKEEFETKMSVIYSALQKSIELGFET